MRDEVLRKLSAELSKRTMTEAEVVYVLVQIRKLMETIGTEQQDSLKLFCDWALHTSLTRSRSIEPMFRAFDDAAEPGGKRRAEYEEYSSLGRLRSELRTFLKRENLPAEVVEDEDRWRTFRSRYKDVISDVPVMYTRASYPFRNITQITLCKLPGIYDGGRWIGFDIAWHVKTTRGPSEIWIWTYD